MSQRGASLMLSTRLVNSLNLHLPHAFLRDRGSRVEKGVCFPRSVLIKFRDDLLQSSAPVYAAARPPCGFLTVEFGHFFRSVIDRGAHEHDLK